MDNIVVLRSIVGDLKKDIKKGQNTLDEKTKELLERVEDVDNAIGVLDGNIKDIGKEITEVDTWTVAYLRNIKTKLKDLKGDVEDIKRPHPDPPIRSPTSQPYRPYIPPNIQQHPLVQPPAPIAKDVKVLEPEKFDGSTDSLLTFLHQVNNVFYFQKNAYSTEEAKIRYVSSLFKGAALRWFDAQKINLTQQLEPGAAFPRIKWGTFEEFWKSLTQEFGNLHE